MTTVIEPPVPVLDKETSVIADALVIVDQFLTSISNRNLIPTSEATDFVLDIRNALTPHKESP